MDERSFKYPNRQAQQAAYAPQAMNRPYSPPPVPGYARAYPPAMGGDFTAGSGAGAYAGRFQAPEQGRSATRPRGSPWRPAFPSTAIRWCAGSFSSHRFDPTLTIKGNSIIFNNSCISKLEQVVYVQILVNPDHGKTGHPSLCRGCAGRHPLVRGP